MSIDNEVILKAIETQNQMISGLKDEMGELKKVVVQLARVEEKQIANDKEAHEAFQRVYLRVETVEEKLIACMAKQDKEIKAITSWQDKNGLVIEIGKKIILTVITTGAVGAVIYGLMAGA